MTQFKMIETLVAAIQELSLARNMETIIQIVRTYGRKILNSDGAAFILRDHDFCFYVDEDAISPLWKGKRFPIASCISGWAILNKEAVVIEDIYNDQRIPINDYKDTFVRSMAMVPIRKLNPIGAIGIYWGSKYQVKQEEIKLIQLLADSTSIAIENLNSYTQVDSTIQKLAIQLEEKERQKKEIELEKQQLEETQYLLNAMGNIAKIGGWKFDLATQKLSWSEEVYRIHEVHEEFVPSIENIFDLYEGESRQKLQHGIKDLLQSGKSFNFELELKSFKCHRKTVKAIGRIQHSKDQTKTFIYGTFQDITKQKKAEQKLVRSEAELKKVQEIAHIGSWYLDVESNEVRWTDELFRMYDFDPQKPVPPYTEHMKLFTPESWEILSNSLAITREKGIPYELELNLIKKDGSKGWMWARGEAVKDEKGKIIGLWGAAQDITERKKPEQELAKAKEKAEKSEARLVEAQKATKVGSWETDLCNLDVIWSAETFNIFDLDPQTFQASHPKFLEFVHPDDRIKVNDAFVKSFDTKDYNTVEHRIITAKGNLKYVEERWKIEFDLEGKPIKAVGTCQDISIRKQFEEELNKSKKIAEENEKQFRQLFENMEQGFAFHEMIYDNHGNPVDYRFLLINEAFEKLTGIDASKFLNKTAKEVIPQIEQSWIENYSQVALTGKPLQFENYLAAFDRYYNVIAYSPKKNYFAVVFTDITKSKIYEKEIIEAKNKAEESDRLKSAFLANMSHEIRTPMNGILGFTDLLLNPDLSSEQKESYIKIVHQSGQRMLNTVNDIIEISKIEAGLVNVALKEININNQVESLVRFFQPESSKKGLELIIDELLPDNVKIHETDESKLDSILTNLIKNAIKFTESGSIHIGCRINNLQIQFYVKDSGVGIPKDRQAAIFERFIQVNFTNKKVFEGSGLGLAISKSYVEMLGGTMWVESREDEGSTFYFTISSNRISGRKTIDDAKKMPVNLKEGTEMKKLRVVVAEDDEISRKYILLLMKSYISEIYEATTGTEAVQLCKDLKDIDLILMDIKMPEMDGYEATREIRGFNKEVVIIAQTAYALSSDKDKVIEAGCNDYLAKPIRIQELNKLINKYFKNK